MANEKEQVEDILESAKVSEFNFDYAASVNFYVVSPDGYNHQITIRSHATMEDVSHLFEVLATAEGWLLDAGYVPKQVGRQPEAAIEVETIPGEPEYVPDEMESPFGGGGIVSKNVFKTVQIKIAPKEGGKSEIQFFGNEHKQPVDDYATLYYTDSHERLVHLMRDTGNWQPEHFTQPKTYKAELLVEWVNSENISSKTGKPYKDVVAVRKV